MKVIYQSTNYAPELVTGKYVRCNGRKPNYSFRVFETATGTGRWSGQPGMGSTLREYDTDGEDLPTSLKERCIASKQMHAWK